MRFILIIYRCNNNLQANKTTSGQNAASNTNTDKTKNGKLNTLSSPTWSPAELQLLIKATTLFPIGMAERWRCVAHYISEHSQTNGQLITEKEVIKQVRALYPICCVIM